MQGSNNAEDLTVIKGIGKVRQQWLREHLDVRRLTDLAHLDAAWVEEKMSQERMPPSRAEISRWIEEAALLAGTEDTLPAAPTGNPEEPGAQDVVKRFLITVRGQSHPADIIISHTEDSAHQAEEWLGHDIEQALAWLRTQLAAVAESIPDKGIARAAPEQETAAQTHDLTFSIDAYTLLKAGGPLHVQAPFQGEHLLLLEQDKPFDLEIDLSIAETGQNVDETLTYNAGLQISPIDHRQASTCLRCDELLRLKPKEGTHKALLRQLKLQAGQYNSWISVTPQQKRAAPAIAKGPRIVVV